MEIRTSTTIDATAEQVFEFMTSPGFLALMTETLDAVSGIEEAGRTEREGALERTLRYTAPTASKIPGFLKKYADQAPENVHWEERGTWDLATHTLTYEIVPDIPDSWHDRYSNQGQLTLTPTAQGKTLMEVTLRFDVNVFGFKKLIERALRPEVQSILELQGQALAAHMRDHL